MRFVHTLGLLAGPLFVFAAASAAPDAPRPATPKKPPPLILTAPAAPGDYTNGPLRVLVSPADPAVPLYHPLIPGESADTAALPSKEAVRFPMVIQRVDPARYPIVVAHGDPARYAIRVITPPGLPQALHLTPRMDPRLLPTKAPARR